MIKKIITLVSCCLFYSFFAQSNAVSFSVRQVDAEKIELTIINSSPQKKVLYMDTSNLRITDAQNFDLEYEMFLTNVLVYKKNGGYAVPFTRYSSTYQECHEFGENRSTDIQDYIKSNRLELKGKETKKILYDLSKQENIHFDENESIKKMDLKVKVVYKGKNIEQYLKNRKCFTSKKDLEGITFENISSNTVTMNLNVQKIMPPK
ncbi:hypothetical protein [Chryseobacterium sp. SIMBA_029]|uniref:hypothetical protein n=1 Tax=Chryseobacterium sp. SIMBA_029 TaxID=3085772 RepID=UPI00397E3458